MVLDIYNGVYGVPAKCGSRYWAKTLQFNKWDIPVVRSSFIEFFGGETKFEWIMIRNPLSHLESALQTEIMECFNDTDKIKSVLLSFCDLYDGGTHFNPEFCQRIYVVWYKSKYKLGIVDLSNLTEFLNGIGFDIPYKTEEYDFKWDERWVSKESVWNKCVELYPDLMDKLVNYTNIDTKYYHALLNGDRSLIKIL